MVRLETLETSWLRRAAHKMAFLELTDQVLQIDQLSQLFTDHQRTKSDHRKYLNLNSNGHFVISE